MVPPTQRESSSSSIQAHGWSMLFLCWRQAEWLTWGRVLSGILTYIVTYVNISSPPVMGPTMDRAALPKLQGTEPLCPLGWDTTVTQVWGQAPRFTTTPSPVRLHHIPLCLLQQEPFREPPSALSSREEESPTDQWLEPTA